MDYVCFWGINCANKHNLIPVLVGEPQSQTRGFSVAW